MTFKTLHTIILSILCFGLSLQAQPIISLPDITVDETAAFDVDVKVSDFDEIVGMQFTVGWDKTKLDFITVYNIDLQGLAIENFGTDPMVVDNGLLTLSWFDSSLSGVSVPNDHVLFTIRLKATGNDGDVVPLIFADTLAIVELIDVNQNVLAPTLDEGQVTLDNSTSLERLENDEAKLFGNFPNPFKAYTFLQFEIKETTKTTLIINDISGKEIYRKTDTYHVGLHEEKIDASVFPASGEYIYTVQTSDNQLIGKLIFVK